jgi:hypothetical protein
MTAGRRPHGRSQAWSQVAAYGIQPQTPTPMKKSGLCNCIKYQIPCVHDERCQAYLFIIAFFDKLASRENLSRSERRANAGARAKINIGDTKKRGGARQKNRRSPFVSRALRFIAFFNELNVLSVASCWGAMYAVKFCEAMPGPCSLLCSYRLRL